MSKWSELAKKAETKKQRINRIIGCHCPCHEAFGVEPHPNRPCKCRTYAHWWKA